MKYQLFELAEQRMLGFISYTYETSMAQALILPIFVMDLFDPVNRHWHSILMKVLVCKCLFVEETG